MKKLLSLLLVVALVLGLFGTVGTAFAAPVFPDIAGNANEKDIVKLFTLGVIGGYADGTFKPEGNITRAEFAKIAVLALGKGGSANLLKNTASQFKDVPAAQWYTGFVNVAVANGIIKGYADGTFKPEANISMAEAATMILRAMGYNDNLPGTWPLNYIMKAADLAIIGDTFVSDALSTRSFVCDATVAMLGYNKAVYNSTTNTFTDSIANGALLAGLSTTVVVNNAQVVSYSATTGKLTLEGGAAADEEILVAAGVKVATGEALSALANKYINFMKHTVDAVTEIIYIEVKTPVVAGKVASVDAVNNQFTLTNGTVVKLATGATITLNGVASTLIGLKDADVTALLGTDGKAYSVVSYVLSITGLLDGKLTTVASGATTLKITIDNGGVHTDYVVPSTTTIVRNGAVGTFADLKIGDDVMMSSDGAATPKAVYIDAYAITKDAVVTSVAVNAAGDKVLSVTFADGTTVAVDSNVTIAPATVHVGYKTKFNLNRTGKISAFVSENIAVNTVTGKITAVGTTVTTTGTTSYATLDNGTSYTLATNAGGVVTTTYSRNKDLTATFAGLKVNDMAVLTINNAGKVTDIAAYANGLITGAEKTAALDADYVATGAVITVNNVADTIDNAALATDAYVTWDVAAGKLTKVEAFTWANADYTVTGTTVTTQADGTTAYVINTAANASTSITLASTGFVVVKDGVVGNFDSIKIGDKVSVATGLKYVKVITDAAFGRTTAADIVLTSNTVISFDDVVKSVKITVNGVDYTTLGDPLNTITIDVAGTHVDLSAALVTGQVVGVLATDYAGNTATFSVVIP